MLNNLSTYSGNCFTSSSQQISVSPFFLGGFCWWLGVPSVGESTPVAKWPKVASSIAA